MIIQFLKNTRNLKHIIFSIVVILLFWPFISKPEVRYSGDYMEYILTSEALSNHGTPYIKPTDVEKTAKILAPKHQRKLGSVKTFVSEPRTQGNYNAGIISTQHGTYVSMHFASYSFITLPVKFFLKAIQVNEYYCFAVTNILLLLLTLAYILYKSTLPEFTKYMLSVLFVFSGSLYYVEWIHPEVYTASFLLLSLLTLYDKKYYLSILFCSIASFQNPSIVFALIFISIYFVYKEGFKIKQILGLIALGSISLLPFIFNYYHFNDINSVSSAINYKNIGLGRMHSTFFDFNQGMIVNIPLIMLLFMFLIVRNTILRRNNFFDTTIILVLVMAIPTMAQTNWNMGQEVFSRYVYWLSMPIIFYISLQLSNSKKKDIVLGTVVLFQAIYGIFLSHTYQNYVAHNTFVSKLLINHPQFYNPDPEIFGERTLHHEGVRAQHSPVCFTSQVFGVTKIMVHKDKLHELRLDTLSANYQSEYIQNQVNNLSFTGNWAYINLKE